MPWRAAAGRAPARPACAPKPRLGRARLPQRQKSNLKTKDMSEKGKARRAAYEERQERKAKKIVNWIFVVLVLLAICFIAYTFTIVQ